MVLLNADFHFRSDFTTERISDKSLYSLIDEKCLQTLKQSRGIQLNWGVNSINLPSPDEILMSHSVNVSVL